MLSQETIATIKATVPVLSEHGEDLTKHFYKRMFANNPEVAPFFNPAHQAAGTQQRALAGAILAYAPNIDNLQALGDAVDLIAHKHVSLMITEDQYPIVGENLLGAIKDVLGDAATDDILKAWGEAYGLLATVLIDAEKKIYETNANKAGGWRGFRTFTVAKIHQESPAIRSLHLRPSDDGDLPSYEPGQFLTLRMATPAGSTTMRNYSLSAAPGGSEFRISVKKEPGSTPQSPSGYVSNILHDEIKEGSTIEVGPPCGSFTLDLTARDDGPLVLLAGGVGITPILSMVHTAAAKQPDRKIVLVHANTDEDSQAFRQELEQLAASHDNLTLHFCYDEIASSKINEHRSQGQVDDALLARLVPNFDGTYYFCGPQPFMAAVYQLLRKRKVPETHINLEFFGPKQALLAPQGKPTSASTPKAG